MTVPEPESHDQFRIKPEYKIRAYVTQPSRPKVPKLPKRHSSLLAFINR